MKTRQLPFVALLVLLFSFCGSMTVKSQIVVGFAYRPMPGSCSQFDEAAGYTYEWNNNNFSSTLQQVKDRLADRYNVSESNIMTFNSGDHRHAVIIRYKKNISGYNCTKTSYAAGFGDSYDDALDDAINEMHLYYSGSDYLLEVYIH